ncbi:MAG: DNA repair protein RadC [Alphaproteobacteria bacterium]|nr:DNA repair protein RadC [Alphaproteobacteria bacterium]
MDGTLHDLGDVELVGSLLGRDGLVTAARLLERFGDVASLGEAALVELAQVRGVGPVRAARLRVAVELGRRAQVRPHRERGPVDAPERAHAWLAPALTGLPHEELHALYLDRRHRPLGVHRLTRGSDQYTVVDPRQIFRPAVRMGAHAVVLAHNHPSGDPTPSTQDREVTRRLADAGRVLGIALMDHLVIGDGSWRSLREHGELSAGLPLAAAWTA